MQHLKQSINYIKCPGVFSYDIGIFSRNKSKIYSLKEIKYIFGLIILNINPVARQ